MDEYELFRKYRGKLVLEGLLKAFVIAAAIGFAVAAIVGVATWIAGVNGLAYSLIAFGAALAVCTALLYFLKFRPDERAVAKRIDALGLDERLITRLSLKEDSSYMAEVQSQDAARALGELSTPLRIVIPAVTVVIALVAMLAGVGMTVVSAMSAGGYIPTFDDVTVDKTAPEYLYENFVVVRYVVINADESGSVAYNEDGTIPEGDVGVIDGDIDQIVELGGNASPVYADPDTEDDGWGFAGWYCFDAGELVLDSEDPFRFDEKVSLDHALGLDDEDYRVVFYYALYVPVTRGSGQGDGGDGEAGDGDQPGEQDQPEDGEPSDNPAKPSDGSMGSDPPEDESGDQSDGAGGSYNPNGPENQVIDGNTNYHEVADEYAELAGEELELSDDLPEEYREFIQQYLSTLV